MVYSWIDRMVKLSRRAFAAVALALLGLLAAGGRARAATVEVDAGVMGGSCCVFKTIDNVSGVGTNSATVNVGDTVHWVWKTNFHSVSSNTGAWTDSGVHNSGFTFDVTFNAAGSFPYHCSIHGGMTGVINVVAPGATVTGHIALEGVSDLSTIRAPIGAFHISLRTPGTTTEIKGYDVTPAATAGSPNGGYALTAVAPGTYDVAIQGPKNLRVAKSGVLIAGSSGVIPDVTLPAGDANGDNAVDTTDFGLLVGAYGGALSIPGSGYDAAADFNYDGFVDTSDFGLLVGEYGVTGAL